MVKKKAAGRDTGATSSRQLRKRLRKAEAQLLDATAELVRAQARVEALSIIADEVRAQLAEARQAAGSDAAGGAGGRGRDDTEGQDERVRETADPTVVAQKRSQLVALPFSVYLGWITVATIANISQMLYWAGYLGEPLGEGLWAVIVLGTGLAIAVIMLLREADWAFGLVIVWAYVGIAVQQEEIIAVVSEVVGAFIVAATVGYVLRQRRVAVAGSPALQRR